MSEKRALHHVRTHEEADRLLAGEPRSLLSVCGCRMGCGHRNRSSVDVRLEFRADAAAPPTGRREITRSALEDQRSEAAAKNLVTPTFRDEAPRTQSHGIRFWCDDSCGSFKNRVERCDKSVRIEATDPVLSNDCLACVEACHSAARRTEGPTLPPAQQMLSPPPSPQGPPGRPHHHDSKNNLRTYEKVARMNQTFLRGQSRNRQLSR